MSQHKQPCGDCPWRRNSLPGWVGGVMTPETWIESAHRDDTIECHTSEGHDCAGAAIYRANVCKRLRDPEAFKLPQDREKVFDTASQFLEHHNQLGHTSADIHESTT